MEDEPEPCPGAKNGGGGVRVSCQNELNRHISLVMQAHFQLLQLSADVACVSCYFSSCAPIFLRLAESAKSQAGCLIDVVLSQGGSIELPAISSPCPNLALDREEGEQTLAAALEACVQLETSKELDAFAEAAHRKGNSQIRKVADTLSSESRRTQTELMRVLSAVLHSQSKLEALAHFRSLMSR